MSMFFIATVDKSLLCLFGFFLL